jgi:leucyl aminopeptidase
MRILFQQAPDDGVGALAVFSAKDRVLATGARRLDEAGSGQLARALEAVRFDGEAATLAEILAPAGTGATRVLVLGVGEPSKVSETSLERVGGAIAARLLTSGEKRVTIDASGLDDLAVPAATAAAHIAHGLELRAWSFTRYRTKLPPKQKPSLDEVVIVNAPEGAAQAYERMKEVAGGVFLTRELVTEPANIIYPETFAQRAQSLSELGVKVEVLGEEALRELGMGALLGVAQGSARPPAVLVMHWDGTGGDGSKPVLLVGKGVTFDTGGISIKPAAGMEDMKWDMGGAAAVVGALHALAARKARANVVGICGLVENMPSGTAQRPGDVVTTMSGQTVEVINTDAEGRLVLCDVMWYGQERFEPSAMVDLATLTGAIIMSLGSEYAGLFSNDDGLAAQLVAAGEATGDKLWRMPLGEAYDKQIESPIADMKNIGGREAGSVTAAQFLQRFVKPGVAWAHLDIAGTVWASKAGSLWDKGATGYGVRLLDRWVAENYELR